MTQIADRGEMLCALAAQDYVAPDTGSELTPMGVFEVVHYRKGKIIGREIVPNLVTTEGLTHLLSVAVAGGTQYSPWYVAIFEGNYTPVAGLTAANFTANATECTAYDEAARVTYVEGTPAAGAVSNSASRAEFTMSATKTIYGAALISTSTKSAGTGVCLAAARFSVARAVIDDDVLAIQYSLSLTSA